MSMWYKGERLGVSVRAGAQASPERRRRLQPLLVGIVAAAAIGLKAGCAENMDIAVTSIDIMDFGILEYVQTKSANDPTSSVGAHMTRAQEIRLSQHTDRVPLRSGLAYGIAFVVRGTTRDASVQIQVVLRTTSPCKLKTTGEFVYRNDSVLQVRLNEVRHVGARIAAGDDNHCVDTPGVGTETFEIYHGGRKLAQKSFQIYQESE